ncbi:IPT/TIG domain-containing protein [Micromonospora pisi]|uniref:IPT/TIG domain-containing protein n=1 Tax=Micromonospora pisi TaxID=589240 RepID=A0A495JV53_9ACTN|nr:IPT/TIG domain-containing protein [Micromonospora pisi]RKR92883.1 IPT/TIG domain-containing protein [Micromonospora pisi]
MRPVRWNTSTALVILAAAGAAMLGPASPALAAPGDASATGFSARLFADVAGDPAFSARATIGSVTAPPGGGTDSDTLAIILPGAVGARGTVSVNASRDPGISYASSTVEDFTLNILGTSGTNITATEISADVTCPAVGTQTADTVLNGLTLFGTPVNLVPNTPGVNGSTWYGFSGLEEGELHITLTSTETVTVTGAIATAVFATVSITGKISGFPIEVDAGSVTLASATCERALAAAAPTAVSITPNSGPQSGGQQVTITGTNFVIGDTNVAFDGTPATNVVVAPGGTSLTTTTPSGAVGPGSVLVSTSSGAAAPLAYTYIADGSATSVTNLTPVSGPTAGGTLVTITGTGFQGATGVTFGEIPGTGFTVNPVGTTITVLTPTHDAGSVPVRLVFPAGSATAPNFIYGLATPAITDIDPEQGSASGGTTVTVTGSGFVPGHTIVTICARTIVASAVTVSPNNLSLTFVTPACTSGDTTVTVTTPAGTSDGVTFRYVYGGLPVTGTEVGTLLAIAAALIGAGAVALTLIRRRAPFSFTA